MPRRSASACLRAALPRAIALLARASMPGWYSTLTVPPSTSAASLRTTPDAPSEGENSAVAVSAVFDVVAAVPASASTSALSAASSSTSSGTKRLVISSGAAFAGEGLMSEMDGAARARLVAASSAVKHSVTTQSLYVRRRHRSGHAAMFADESDIGKRANEIHFSAPTTSRRAAVG